MIQHDLTSCLVVTGTRHNALLPLIRYFQKVPCITLGVTERLPADLTSHDVVVTAPGSVSPQEVQALSQFSRSGNGWLLFVDEADRKLPAGLDAELGPPGPAAEIRVLFNDKNNPLAVRLPDALYVHSAFRSVRPSSSRVTTILYADWHYEHHPVLIECPAGSGHISCCTITDYTHPVFQQIMYRFIRHLADSIPQQKDLGVGILGYAPSVGKWHGQGAQLTAGLCLRAVCDLNQERLQQATADFPEVRTVASADALAREPDIDVVIVATAPNTHARLCMQMLEGGKHVVCEKPLTLSRRDADNMATAAERLHLHLGCHQNRRGDVDYLAVKQALSEGMIGDLFYMETFVGGFNHPCGYWHSHEPVSGGTAYDWGGHYLDWTVSLMPDRVTAVIGTRHKRVWHDVSNADQERLCIRFAGGQEAEFIHSDIAAVRKPKWYLLGTQGAIVGRWHDVSTYAIDPVLYFHRHDIPATEMPPELILNRRHDSGKIVSSTLPVPEREDYAFHRNLADHLITGEPITAPLEDSVTVVAILEAAARSAANGGTVEDLDGP